MRQLRHDVPRSSAVADGRHVGRQHRSRNVRRRKRIVRNWIRFVHEHRLHPASRKGKAFADWYKNNGQHEPAIAPTWGDDSFAGYIGLAAGASHEDMGALSSSLVTAGTATPWLYAGTLPNSYDAYYFSFNTPVGTNPATRNAAALIFSDVHLAESPFGAFPTGTARPIRMTGRPRAERARARVSLFRSRASCVQNDTTPPVIPGTELAPIQRLRPQRVRADRRIAREYRVKM